MSIKIRYESFDQFFRLNQDNFKRVQIARKELKSPQELGMMGDMIMQAEKLTYHYINLRSLVSDLLFGVTASVLDAKHGIKTQEAIVFREIEGKQGDKKILLEADQRVIQANQKYNDLLDLKDYLELKWKDFDTSHYYYKNLAQGN